MRFLESSHESGSISPSWTTLVMSMFQVCVTADSRPTTTMMRGLVSRKPNSKRLLPCCSCCCVLGHQNALPLENSWRTRCFATEDSPKDDLRYARSYSHAAWHRSRAGQSLLLWGSRSNRCLPAVAVFRELVPTDEILLTC